MSYSIRICQSRRLESAVPWLSFSLVFAVSLNPLNGAPQVPVEVSIQTDKAVGVVNPAFLSLAIDSSLAISGGIAYLRTPRLVALARGLAPAFLRFGGTEQDFLIFESSASKDVWQAASRRHANDEKRCTLPHYPTWLLQKQREKEEMMEPVLYKRRRTHTVKNATITPDMLDSLNGFASCSGLHLIYGLNALLRGPGSDWNSSNAALLLRYTASKGYNFSWELGNEPNSYPHRTGRNVSGTQLGHDFMALARLLESQGLRSASVYGPDVTRPRRSCLRLLQHFLETAARVVKSVTWHHYYVNGRTATLHDFLDPEILDSLATEIQDVAQVVQKVSPGSKVWLGETSSAWGGGAAGLSDAYVAGFMWLDKLGLSARLGIDVVMRQAFVGHGHYTLVDKENEPLPDYWLSLLYKRLVGRSVLIVQKPGFGGTLRLYTHCTSSDNSPGAVTLFALNLQPNNATMQLTGTLADCTTDEYILEPGDPKAGLRARSVLLNGKKLEMKSETELPPLLPRRLPQGSLLTLPAQSFGFYVLRDAHVPACLPQTPIQG
uniref:heparanase-like n=1 Tax=Myxine glutinosa TaxID=7769 RepID=UPI00358E3DE8